jgi:hypothetical protein
MPIYEYVGPEGERHEALLPSPLPILNWNGKEFRRVEVTRFALAGFKSLPTLGDEVMRGYRIEEERGGSRFRTRLPTRKVKEAWADELTR